MAKLDQPFFVLITTILENGESKKELFVGDINQWYIDERSFSCLLPHKSRENTPDKAIDSVELFRLISMYFFNGICLYVAERQLFSCCILYAYIECWISMYRICNSSVECVESNPSQSTFL